MGRAGKHGAAHHPSEVKNAPVKSGAFALPARPKAGGAEQQWEVVIVDVTERPVERQKKAAQMLLGQEEASPAEKARSPWTRQ